MSLAVLDGGTFYHYEAIYGPRYRAFFDRAIYAPQLAPEDLADIDMLIVADRIDPVVLRRYAGIFADFLGHGGTLVVLGETEAETWAPAVRWSSRPTNFWWWLEKGAVPAQQLAQPDHSLFRHLPFKDTIWHFHGVLFPPPGAEALIVVPADPEGRDPGGALLYEDRVSTPGRLIVSTLDPFYHHGSRFMPAATRFLDGFLDWARSEARR
jgi:hypothetical protein